MRPDELAELSLTGRLAAALICVERVGRAQGLADKQLQDFLDYLWEFPVLASPDAFQEWHDRPVVLVEVGLGDPLPEHWCARLATTAIRPEVFRELLESTVEVVFSSFYAASDNEGSLTRLTRVAEIATKLGAAPPGMEPFRFSRFADRQGWGEQLTPPERDRWRALA